MYRRGNTYVSRVSDEILVKNGLCTSKFVCLVRAHWGVVYKDGSLGGVE